MFSEGCAGVYIYNMYVRARGEERRREGMEAVVQKTTPFVG